MAGENKRIASFYVAARDRGESSESADAPTRKPPAKRQGMLGQLMNAPMEKYLALHPDMACRWEHVPNDNNMSMVPFREGQGYHIVDASELSPDTDSAQKTGPIRKGDLVLMACKAEIQQAILDQDAEIADADYRTPETTYKEAMAEKIYKTGDGTVLPGSGFGKITRKTEEIDPSDFVQVSPTGK